MPPNSTGINSAQQKPRRLAVCPANEVLIRAARGSQRQLHPRRVLRPNHSISLGNLCCSRQRVFAQRATKTNIYSNPCPQQQFENIGTKLCPCRPPPPYEKFSSCCHHSLSPQVCVRAARMFVNNHRCHIPVTHKQLIFSEKNS